ncbi:hypothetical protein ACSSNL_18615 [Thalassobius sp. S69A]|uniref:hypothetical protein n=1 Tax=unclassified Thalassovita TaxID=2619711 RepID=UPI003C7B0473
MKIYTQEEFDALPVVNGVRHCPTGDYSKIKAFGEECSFESGRVKPLNWRKPYFAVDRIGSEHRKAYFFKSADGETFIRAGCFFGDRAAFLKKLHADADHQKTAIYEAALALAEMVLEEESTK